MVPKKHAIIGHKVDGLMRKYLMIGFSKWHDLIYANKMERSYDRGQFIVQLKCSCISRDL